MQARAAIERSALKQGGLKSEGITKKSSKKLSAADFEVVKEQQRDDTTTDYVAKLFNFDVQQVIDAFASDSYRTYKIL